MLANKLNNLGILTASLLFFSCSAENSTERSQNETNSEKKASISLKELRAMPNADLKAYIETNGMPNLSQAEMDQISDKDLARADVSRESFELAHRGFAIQGKQPMPKPTPQPPPLPGWLEGCSGERFVEYYVARGKSCKQTSGFYTTGVWTCQITTTKVHKNKWCHEKSTCTTNDEFGDPRTVVSRNAAVNICKELEPKRPRNINGQSARNAYGRLASAPNMIGD